MRRIAIALFVLTLFPWSLLTPAHAEPAAAGSTVWGDFNGDGFADLAIGVPGDSAGGTEGGAVNVLYGSTSGLTAARDQRWHQARDGVPGSPSSSEEFGRSLGAGDFDGDGHSDLAVGVPEEELEGDPSAGAVNIFYGADRGLTSDGARLFHQGKRGIKGVPRADEFFGEALATGDLDGDGFADLAIGVSEDMVAGAHAGAVNVLFGGPNGLRPAGNELWHQRRPGVKDRPEADDLFGWALAIGRFDTGGFGDLAVGIPNENVGGVSDAGAVAVLRGGPSGLTAGNDLLLHQATPGIPGAPETDDEVGTTLSAANLGRDGRTDLAIGVPVEDVNGATDAGLVHVLFGGPGGLSPSGNQRLHQGMLSNSSTAPETDDHFGLGLASANFGKGGPADLAIGAEGQMVSGNGGAGVVHVVYGGDNGLTDRNQEWAQDTPGIKDSSDSGDGFGRSMSAADYGRRAEGDLAIGVHEEDMGTPDQGAVNVLYGRAAGLSRLLDQLWHQDVPGVRGVAREEDNFGVFTTCAKGP